MHRSNCRVFIADNSLGGWQQWLDFCARAHNDSIRISKHPVAGVYRHPAARDRHLCLVDFVGGTRDRPDRGAPYWDGHICDLSRVSALPPNCTNRQSPRSNRSTRSCVGCAQHDSSTLTGPSMSRAAKPRRCDSVANSSPPTVRVLSCVSMTSTSPGFESARAAMTCEIGTTTIVLNWVH